MNFSLPSQPNLAQLRKQAKSILKLHGQGDPRCCFVLKRLRQFADMPEQKVLDADLALSDVQFALALYYGYESWAALKRHTEMQRPGVVPRLHRTGDGAACIRGLEDLDWGGSFFQRQESFMTCLAAVLQAMGENTSFEDLMGLSGAAFRLQIKDPWCPSQACLGECNCMETALEAFGCSAERLDLADGGEVPDAVRQAIVNSIDSGVPALFIDGEWSLIVGYGDRGGTWVCQVYAGGKGYRSMQKLKGMLNPAWWVAVVRRDRHAPPRRQAVLRSLERIVDLARTPSFKDGSTNGLAAYERWIGDLEKPPSEPNLHANAYTYAILLTSRAAGAVYLNRAADELGGDAGAALRSAAQRYRSVSQHLLTGRDCVKHPWNESWTPENRAGQAETLRRCLSEERAAAAEIERALGAIPAE